MRFLLRRSFAPAARLRMATTEVPAEFLRETDGAMPGGIVATGQVVPEDELPPLPGTVGYAEDARFDCRESVQRWRYHDVDASAARIGASLQNDQGSWPYFAYHGFRSGAMASQSIVTLLLASTVANFGARGGSTAGASFLNQVTSNLPKTMQALGSEVVGALADDYDNIKSGVYKAPWDMSLRHRQLSLPFVLRQSLRGAVEFTQISERRGAAAGGEKIETRNWIQSPLYPSYYTDSFHFQTDGWMSKASADVYEISTESLFVGRQDAMQRSTLVPIQRWRAEGRGGGVDGQGLRMAEFACGTGRFATFVRDNMPAADVTLLDLSPFYLEKARENHQYFERFMGREKVRGKVNYVHAPAEASGLASNSFDVVYSVYLFHEIPQEARAAVAKEMVRVAKPGAVIVLTDSSQLGDRPEMDAVMGNFGNFNEPHYVDFLEDDIGAHFEAAGAVPYVKNTCSVSKALSFIKPLTPSA